MNRIPVSVAVKIILMVVVLLAQLQAEACESIVRRLEGVWTGEPAVITYRPNGGDVSWTTCRTTILDFRATPQGFRIERCWVASCDDETAFSCSTGDMIVRGSEIYEVGDTGAMTRAGSCRGDRMSFTVASALDAWADWIFDVSGDRPWMRKTFLYWNQGSIDTGSISLLRE